MKHRKIKVLKTARLNTVIGAFAGLAAGIVYSFGGLIIDTLVTKGIITSTETSGLSQGTALAFGALIGMPIIFAFWGFVLTVIGAYFYNLFAK